MPPCGLSIIQLHLLFYALTSGHLSFTMFKSNQRIHIANWLFFLFNKWTFIYSPHNIIIIINEYFIPHI